MLRKLLFSSTVLLTSALLYGQNDKNVFLSDVEFSVDTLFHSQVGPGTTQTSLHLINKTTKKKKILVSYLLVYLTK